MKKAALTIGLFSLAIVATSFTTSETLNTISNEELSLASPIDGNGTRDGRHKVDFVGTVDQLNIKYNNSSSFNADRQSVRTDVKID